MPASLFAFSLPTWYKKIEIKSWTSLAKIISLWLQPTLSLSKCTNLNAGASTFPLQPLFSVLQRLSVREQVSQETCWICWCYFPISLGNQLFSHPCYVWQTLRVFQMVDKASSLPERKYHWNIRQQKFKSEHSIESVLTLNVSAICALLPDWNIWGISVMWKINFFLVACKWKIHQESSWTFSSLEGLLTNNSHTSDLWAVDDSNCACLKGSITSECQKDIESSQGVFSSKNVNCIDCDSKSHRKCKISAMWVSQGIGMLPHLLILCQINKFFSRIGFSTVVLGDTVGGLMWAGESLGLAKPQLAQSHLQSVAGALLLVQALGQPDS